MSDDPFNAPPVPEQDEAGGDGLPTYDDLAAQHGPNSRYALVGYPSNEACQTKSLSLDSDAGGSGSRRGVSVVQVRGLQSTDHRTEQRSGMRTLHQLI